MRKKFLCALSGVVLCASLLTLFTGPSHALSAVDVFRLYSPSVATLVVTTKDGRQGQGTGFLVSSRGELLTNFHVVDGADSIAVYFSDDLWFSARRIVAQDPAKDLALVWAEGVSPSLPYLGVSQTRPPEGSDMIVIGTPRGLEKTVTAGIVSGYRTFGSAPLIQFTAPVSPGSSGSPVFDTGGKVVGIVIGGLPDAPGMNFAVEAKEISRFLRTRPFIDPDKPAGGTPGLRPSGNARQASQQRPFRDIVATVETARPGSDMDQSRNVLGAPAAREERGDNYIVNLWRYANSNSVLLVWDRAGKSERADWVEYYAAAEVAEARANELIAQASRSFGNNSRSSQNGAAWKRSGYFIGIEQHSVGDSHMVIVNATR